MKPGDLVVANPGISSLMRIYTDPHCDSWEDQAGAVGLVLGMHKNRYGLEIIRVLLPRGVRWVYRLDVVVP
jgi:hypothetical protein